jgi:hypothetical protein
VSGGNSCNCAGAVAQLQAQVSGLQSEINRIKSEMSQIANAIERMSARLSENISRVEGAVKVSNTELVAIAGTTAATAASVLKFKSDVAEGMDEARRLQERQTSAMVQLDSVRTITEARALSSKTSAFAQEVDERFAKAVEGVFLNRILYDKHFGAIKDEYQSKIRTIGSHIYEIWEKDLRPTEQAAQVPADAYQGLAVEVDLERLAARSSLLESDLDMIRDRHLQPLVALDAQLEQTVEREFAIAGGPREGTEVFVPATVVFTDDSAAAIVDSVIDGDGGLAPRGRLPEHARYCESAEGRAAIRRACRVRPMTREEVDKLLGAMDRLAERGVIDGALLPGYRRYLESVQLGIVDSAVEPKGAGNA